MMLLYIASVTVTKIGALTLFDPFSTEQQMYSLSTQWDPYTCNEEFVIEGGVLQMWYTDAYGQDGLINWTIKDLV